MSDGLMHKASESSWWTGLSRVANVIGTGILLPVAGFIAFLTWQNSIDLSSLKTSVSGIQATVTSITNQVNGIGQTNASQDTSITVLTMEFNSLTANMNAMKDFLRSHLKITP